VVTGLREQMLRLETAMENISIGICVFGPDRRLLVSNRRYAEMYGLGAEQIRPGMTLREIFALRAAVNAVPDVSVDDYIAQPNGQLGMSSLTGTLMDLRNGRVMSVRHQPMADGGYVSSHEDITERRQAEQRLAHLALHDALTGLPNRLLLRERLQQALDDPGASDPCAVLCLDLDHFKDVNDAVGQTLADTVLRGVADRLRHAMAAGETLARIGGDSFAIIQRSGPQPDTASALAARIALDLARPLTVEGHRLTVRASIGIACSPCRGGDADHLLHNAELALAAAKSAGRGRAAVFVPGMDAASQRRRLLGADLREAIDADELSLAFQPIANLDSGRITGFEALLRWNGRNVGPVPPTEFIPLAEENGLIVPIGQWVLMRACAEAAKWPPRLKVAVNVSAAQLSAPGLVDGVAAALRASGLAASRLELEITESTLMRNWEETATVLQRIKQLGVRTSMDDFGTGYSSLSYLCKFPFDKVKIDQAFVRELTTSSQSVAIVRAIVALCGALGMTTTAEGVETAEQLAILTAERCTEAQGYLLSTPRPGHEVQAMLDRLDHGAVVGVPVRRPAFAAAPRAAG
jgi:diguanylate cyclase (GGDEF)-like protein